MLMRKLLSTIKRWKSIKRSKKRRRLLVMTILKISTTSRRDLITRIIMIEEATTIKDMTTAIVEVEIEEEATGQTMEIREKVVLVAISIIETNLLESILSRSSSKKQLQLE
jgi:hypothetical protein